MGLDPFAAVAASGRVLANSSSGRKLPFVNHWNAYCGGGWTRVTDSQPDELGEPMKIYLLMVLISTIAALSHYKSKQQAPEQQA
jgi:hypothetical protein